MKFLLNIIAMQHIHCWGMQVKFLFKIRGNPTWIESLVKIRIKFNFYSQEQLNCLLFSGSWELFTLKSKFLLILKKKPWSADTNNCFILNPALHRSNRFITHLREGHTTRKIILFFYIGHTLQKPTYQWMLPVLTALS